MIHHTLPLHLHQDIREVLNDAGVIRIVQGLQVDQGHRGRIRIHQDRIVEAVPGAIVVALEVEVEVGLKVVQEGEVLIHQSHALEAAEAIVLQDPGVTVQDHHLMIRDTRDVLIRGQNHGDLGLYKPGSSILIFQLSSVLNPSSAPS